jgi:2-polyprenyl-6-methoxyphenol hydroxylase-like FAD-dependent oxidoreductase
VGAILLRHLAKFDNVEVLYDHEITGITSEDDSVTLTVSTAQGEKQFVADWLVGADGASSAVRRLLDLAFEGMTWPDKFVSTNVRADLGSAGMKIANWRIDPVYGDVTDPTESVLWRVLRTVRAEAKASRSAILPQQGRATPAKVSATRQR